MPFSSDGLNAPLWHADAAWVMLELGDTARALQILGAILDKPRSVTKAVSR